MKKLIEIILVPIFLIVIFFVVLRSSPSKTNIVPVEKGSNVSVVDGKQIIEITARGGYSPRSSVAKAGLPTILRFKTSGTFDCSSSVRIPSKNISQLLSSSGVTDIDLGTSSAQVLQGSCGMGMYPFSISFI